MGPYRRLWAADLFNPVSAADRPAAQTAASRDGTGHALCACGRPDPIVIYGVFLPEGSLMISDNMRILAALLALIKRW